MKLWHRKRKANTFGKVIWFDAPETRRSLSGSKGDDTEGLPIPKGGAGQKAGLDIRSALENPEMIEKKLLEVSQMSPDQKRASLRMQVRITPEEKSEAKKELGENASDEEIREAIINERLERLENRFVDDEKKKSESDYITELATQHGYDPEEVKLLRIMAKEEADASRPDKIKEQIDNMYGSINMARTQIEQETGEKPGAYAIVDRLEDVMQKGEGGEKKGLLEIIELIMTEMLEAVGDYFNIGNVQDGQQNFTQRSTANPQSEIAQTEFTASHNVQDLEKQLNAETKAEVEKVTSKFPKQWHGSIYRSAVNSNGAFKSTQPLILHNVSKKTAAIYFPGESSPTYCRATSGYGRIGSKPGSGATPLGSFRIEKGHQGGKYNTRIYVHGLEAQNNNSHKRLIRIHEIRGSKTAGCTGLPPDIAEKLEHTLAATSGGRMETFQNT
jgi:hypothetical protein